MPRVRPLAIGSPVVRTLATLLRDRRGATAIEYGLIISLVVIALIGGLSAFANKTNGMWNNVATEVLRH